MLRSNLRKGSYLINCLQRRDLGCNHQREYFLNVGDTDELLCNHYSSQHDPVRHRWEIPKQCYYPPSYIVDGHELPKLVSHHGFLVTPIMGLGTFDWAWIRVERFVSRVSRPSVYLCNQQFTRRARRLNVRKYEMLECLLIQALLLWGQQHHSSWSDLYSLLMQVEWINCPRRVAHYEIDTYLVLSMFLHPTSLGTFRWECYALMDNFKPSVWRKSWILFIE